VQLKVHKTYIFIVSYNTSRSKYDNARWITEIDNSVLSLDIATDSNNVNVATYPSTGGRREGSQVRLPREENARSRHQCLFEENVEKIKMCGLRTLIVKGSGVVFTHGKGISTPRVLHKGQQPLMKCANITSKCFIFPFLCLFVFLCFLYFLYFLSFCG